MISENNKMHVLKLWQFILLHTQKITSTSFTLYENNYLFPGRLIHTRILPTRLTKSQLLFWFLMVLSLPEPILANTEKIFNENQQISIEYGDTLSDQEQQQTAQWLKNVTQSLLKIYGAWPKDKIAIQVIKTSGAQGPVPWGQVERDKVDKVTLYINPSYGFEAIAADWTVYHELSHLLLPYRGYGDLWISEGLASYYQNIIQVRSARINEAQFWDNIVSGLERGESQSNHSRKSLLELSDNMSGYKDYMRVHWSGVLFWLKNDVKIRLLSRGKQSLDSLLQQLKYCCETKQMSAIEIMQKLDVLAGYKIFIPLFKVYGNSYKLPEYRTFLEKLGIDRLHYSPFLKKNKQAKYAFISAKIVDGNAEKYCW